MFATTSRRGLAVAVRQFSTTRATAAKVAVVGAAGGIGQPLSLLLKLDPSVKELSLFDIVNTPGVAADLSHIPTPGKVTGLKGAENMRKALEGADIIVIPAGVPRKPGMTRDDLFNTNASIVRGIAEASAEAAPNAAYCIISNPVNSTVPIFAEVLKKSGEHNKDKSSPARHYIRNGTMLVGNFAGKYNPKKLFGVTTLDIIRAKTFVAENQKWDPTNMEDVPVLGGHAGTTILPLLSQVKGAKFSQDDIAKLTHRIQFGGDEVVKAKDGTGSATLSMAYAGYLFAAALIKALNGQSSVQYTFIENNLTKAPFFATAVTLGKAGVDKIHPLPPMNDYEKEMLEKAIPDLIAQAKKGVEFVNNPPPKK